MIIALFGVLGVINSYCIYLHPHSSSQGDGVKGSCHIPSKINRVRKETFARLIALVQNMEQGLITVK